MRSIKRTDWEPVITALRWIARVTSVVYTVLLWILTGGFGGATPAHTAWSSACGFLVAGFLVSIFWTGIGELMGGMVLLPGPIWVAPVCGGLGWMAVMVGAPFTLAGLLFTACGAYTLTRRGRATRAPA
jgi:hypothetical protein